ncbi:GntR family transcriptional regulator [Arthrobacter crystallopoietes]|jgi:DNA-binding GntR family transcriptional regulator|uniref:GntR family transcriptional regulator n=1 Tax=Micrococcaceae TaxID=1268 RepID=UPI0021CA0CDF|nr:GntR family transcriptional regulator [Arthrobacter sp. Marseille-P9274]
MQEMLMKTQGNEDSSKEHSLLDRVRTLILGGQFPPGAPVSEVFLAQEFEVSRTPIRETLKQLQHEGLVEIRPKVGTFVREPTRREIVELFQLKESLEGLAAGLLTRRGKVREISILERNVEESVEAAAEQDAERYAELVHEFHRTIITGADNNKLVEHYERLMNQLAYHRLVLRTAEHPGRISASTSEHRTVLSMIKDKDHFGAEAAMRNHVYASSREVLTDSRTRND